MNIAQADRSDKSQVFSLPVIVVRKGGNACVLPLFASTQLTWFYCMVFTHTHFETKKCNPLVGAVLTLNGHRDMNGVSYGYRCQWRKN